MSLTASSAAVSARMRRQRRADTSPELAVRRILHRSGYRYFVHVGVPGMSRRTIDIAFPRWQVAAFIDGCYWHSCPEHGTAPAANRDWWAAKLRANHGRDLDTDRHLGELGWRVIRIWEHEDPIAGAARVAEAVEELRSARR